MTRRIRLIGICSAAAILASCAPCSEPESGLPNDTIHDPAADFDPDAIHDKVVSLCGACHPYPDPAAFPKRYWPELVEQAYQWYRESPREDLKKLDAPPIEDIIRYYASQAPGELNLPPANPQLDTGGLHFHQETIPSSEDQPFAAIAHLRWWPAEDERHRSLLICDMAAGKVLQVHFEGRKHRIRLLAELDYPAHVEPCDLDGDGHFDFVVADLGSFEPADHDRGRVIWLRWDSTKDQYEPVVIQQQLGRVADVQPADFDGDGDLDLAVAEFGWRTTGRVLLLEQVVSSSDADRFRMHVVDERHGSIHVPVADMNGDGHLDFIALISQQHETIVANLNRGDATFGMQQIFGGPGPSYGSSGIQLVDLDRDGDEDVLYTNGDQFDTLCLQPYHSVQWLENRGSYPFDRHLVANLPGAYRALAGDLDNDADQDIVVCCWTGKLQTRFNSLTWFEQQDGCSFVRHDLEYAIADHATMEIGDFDGNGYVDFAVGHFLRSRTSTQTNWLTLWWNEGPEHAVSASSPGGGQDTGALGQVRNSKLEIR